MTHFLQRSALILLATTAFCATPALAKTHGHKAAAAPPTAANGKIVTLKGDRAAYVVKKGDTLEKIADKLDTKVSDLLTDNKLTRTSVLQPGDVLKGPIVTKKAYVVAHGDTVFSIAKRFHVTVEELRDENDLSAKTSIHPGQQIRLPADYRAPAIESADEPADTPDKAGGDKAGAGKADAEPSKAAKGRKGRTPPPEAAADSAPAGDHAAAGRIATLQSKGESYKAKKGDTLAKIADRLDTDVGDLKRLNHLRGTTVRAGQIYRGPSFTEHVYTALAGETLAQIAQRFGVSVERLRAENELSKRVISVRQGQKIYLPDGYHDRNAPADERPTRSYPQPYQPDGALPSRPQPYQPSGRPYVPPSTGQAPDTTTPSPTDAQVSAAGKGRFQWPLHGDILSDFGPKPGGQFNAGINIQAEAGAPVRSAADGDVVYAGDQVPGFGNLVLIKHADGWVTAYAHLSRVDVKNQQKVTQGQQIGQAGNSGGVPEPQLHFEVRYAASAGEAARKPVDPKLVLPK
jgi:murein DD-endopeptidase MepM/ murein hydrolase activator NlpD